MQKHLFSNRKLETNCKHVETFCVLKCFTAAQLHLTDPAAQKSLNTESDSAALFFLWTVKDTNCVYFLSV